MGIHVFDGPGLLHIRRSYSLRKHHQNRTYSSTKAINKPQTWQQSPNIQHHQYSSMQPNTIVNFPLCRPAQCHFLHHKSHTASPRNEPRISRPYSTPHYKNSIRTAQQSRSLISSVGIVTRQRAGRSGVPIPAR